MGAIFILETTFTLWICYWDIQFFFRNVTQYLLANSGLHNQNGNRLLWNWRFDRSHTQFMYLHDEYNSSAYYNTFREFQQNSSTATIILASKPHSSTTKTPPMFLTLSGLALESLLLSWKVSNEYDFQMQSIFKVFIIRSENQLFWFKRLLDLWYIVYSIRMF